MIDQLLLPTWNGRTDKTAAFDETVFDSTFDHLQSLIVNDEVLHGLLTPINLLELDSDPVQMESGLTLEKLSDVDIIKLLRYDFLPTEARGVYAPHLAASVGLYRRIRCTRSQEMMPNTITPYLDEAARVLDAVYVSVGGLAEPLGTATTLEPDLGMVGGRPHAGTSFFERFHLPKIALQRRDSRGERLLERRRPEPFDEVASTLGRAEPAVRKLASRAREHVRDSSRRSRTDPAELRRVRDAFLAALQNDDPALLAQLLTEGVVFTSDGGGKVPAAAAPVVGRERVTRLLFGLKGERLASNRPHGAGGAQRFTRHSHLQRTRYARGHCARNRRRVDSGDVRRAESRKVYGSDGELATAAVRALKPRFPRGVLEGNIVRRHDPGQVAENRIRRAGLRVSDLRRHPRRDERVICRKIVVAGVVAR